MAGRRPCGVKDSGAKVASRALSAKITEVQKGIAPGRDIESNVPEPLRRLRVRCTSVCPFFLRSAFVCCMPGVGFGRHSRLLRRQPSSKLRRLALQRYHGAVRATERGVVPLSRSLAELRKVARPPGSYLRSHLMAPLHAPRHYAHRRAIADGS